MKKCAIAILVTVTMVSPAYAGKNIVGTGKSVEEACWNYNQRANTHARVSGSCWGTCKVSGVVEKDGQFSYSFNNPNHAGSCPKRKYDGGSGLNEPDFYSAYPPPAGIPNPYATTSSSQARSADWRFEDARPKAGQGVLLVWNTTTEDVRFDCEVNKNGSVYARETFILPPNNRYEKGYHSFQPDKWTATCEAS